MGLTSALSANISGGTWTSSNTAKATVGSASGIVTGVAAGTATITYTMPTGCYTTLPLTVNGVPSAISGLSTVCAGGTITLTESVSGGAWSSNDTTIATVNTGGTVTGVAGGTTTISYVSGPSCNVTKTVTVGPISAITGTTTACVGLTTTLSDATAGGTWTSSNTAVGTIGSGTGVVTGIGTGTATISYSIGSGCTRTTAITVNAVPAAITGTTTVCAGLTTTLIESVSGGSWSSSNTSTATVGSSSGVVTGIAAGTVTISYISGSSCYVTSTVTVNPLPASITGTVNVCAGLTTTLSDATSGGTWTSSNTGLATVGTGSGIVTGVASGNPVITYTLPTGCIMSATITVNPIPASITGTANVCVGLTRTLSDATGSGTWSSGNTSTATIGTTGIVTGVAAGTVNITYTLATGCLNSTPFTVNALPASITGTATVCAGLTTTLSNSTGGGTWTSGTTGVATIGSSSGTATGVAAGNSTITYTLATGCTSTRILTVYALPASISGSTNVCVGLTRTLSDGTSGGNWTSSNTSFATVGSGTGIVTGIASGALTISYTLSTGCLVTSPMTVNPLPAAITGPTSLCNGSNITLSDATSGGSWRSNDVTNITIGSGTGIVSVVSADTTTVFYTLPTGCIATAVITSNDVPAAISGAIDTCVGLTTTLTDGTSGGTWSSNNTSIATIGSASGIATGIAAGTAVISYTLSSTGCYAIVGFPVDPLPSSITGTLNVCVGSITNLDDLVTGGTWVSSNASVADVDPTSGDVTGIASGTATITYTLSTGCKTTSVTTVNSMPTLSVATNNGPICAGTTLTLTAGSPANVTGYSWSGPVSITSSTSASASVPAATVAAAGDYTVTVTNGTGVGCSDDYITTVVVNATPTAAPTNSGPICRGGTVTLTSNPANGASVYSWSGASLSSTTAQNPTATPTVTTTYSLTVTDGSGHPGCSPATVYTTIVTVNATPAAAPTNNGPICTGSTVTLTANPSGGAATYSWSGASLSSSTAQNPTATPTVTTTYSLTVTNGSGFSGCSPATVYTTTVTVNSLPALTSASNSGPICAGATLTLNSNGASNVTGYTWSGPVAITNSTSASATVPAATTSASGTYTVTVVNGSGIGCSRTYTTAATVNALPTAAPSSNTPICNGGTVTFAANPAGTTNTYTWSGSNLSSTTAQNPTATPTVTATYSLTVSFSGGLPGCSPATVYTTTATVNSVPTASPTNNGPSCSGSSVTLTATPGGSANTYVWSGANLTSTTGQNPTATPTVTSTYSLTVSYGTGNPGCSPATVYTTTVTVYPSGRWSGAIDTNWNNNSNWCGNIPTVTSDVLIPGSLARYPSVSSGTNPSHNITVQSGATLKVNTGATLQIAGSISNSGTFTATYGGIEMNGSSSQTIPSGVFSGNSIKNLTISNSAGVSLSGALSISGILKVTTGTFTTGGYITLLSTSTQTALIDGSGAGTVSGNLTMQRYLDSSYGYRYISSPFQAATLTQLSGPINFSSTFPNFYAYNENVNYAGWVIDTALADTIKPMHGYAANFGTAYSSSTFSLTGAVNNGSMSYTLYNHNNTYTLGYNLVGNPYPSPIDWTASSGWTKTNIDNAVYYFNHGDTNQYYGRYSSYISGVSSDGIANNIIPAMQGFFVHVSNGTYPVTGTLACTNSVRTTGLTPHYFKLSGSSYKPLVRIGAGFANDGSNADPAVVYFDDFGTANFDRDLDALKIINTDVTIPSLYSVSQDENNLSIQSLPALTDSDVLVPLGVQTGIDGTVTFNARNIENIPSGMHVWFYDAKTGKSQDLKTAPKYEVQLASGKYEDRFFLMLSKADAINISGVNGALNAYTYGGSLFVYLGLNKGDLVITDIAGQIAYRQALDGFGFHEIKLQLSSGIYIATLYSGIGKQSKKIFLGH